MANEGDWHRGWQLREGVVHVLPTDTTVLSVHFVGLTDRRMNERPTELLKNPKAPDEMQREELDRYIRGMQRSGVNVNPLRVELMLRIAIPATCLIIFMFGAPLATSSKRGGAALGVGISLATTVMFLMLVQLTKAIGKEGMLPPELAAWVPSLAFGVAGVVLLAKVRT
jgi:lipopolysaccharide export system permease protein